MPFGVAVVIEVISGPLRSISSVPLDNEEKFPAASTTTILYRPPALGVSIVPVLPVVCFVIFVLRVSDVTEEGSVR